MRTVLQDIRYGCRVLRNSPGFTAVAVLSLALGIGANTAIFSFINAALVKPLRVAEPERLVSLYQRGTTNAAYFTPCSYPEFEYYRTHSRSFSGMLAYLRIPMMARIGGSPSAVSGELVSPEYFPTLGLQARAGHLLGPGDGGNAAVVVSEDFWKSRLGGDQDAIGRTLRVGDGAVTIVGVAPRSFRGIVLDWAEPPSIWIPAGFYRQAVPALRNFDVLHAWGMQSYLVTARLRTGVTLERAQAEIAAVAERLRHERPGNAASSQINLTAALYPIQLARFWPSHRGSILTFLSALMVATGLVLLIACFNLANMLLARAAGRSREMAVRLALGAGRGRITRQLLTESLLVSAMGGAAGLLVAVWILHFLAQFRKPFGITLALDTAADGRVLAFSFAATLAAGILSGLVPAFQASRCSLVSAMKLGAGASSRTGRFGLRNTLVMAQVALSVLLVTAAVLFVRTLQEARTQEITVRSEDVVLLTLDLASAGYDEARSKRFYPRVLEAVRSLPGVRNAALVWIMPWNGSRGGTDISVTGRAPVQVDFNQVSSGYFATAGIPVVRGRTFSDHGGAVRLAVVNEAFAREFWPGADPVGKHFEQRGVLWEIAGVVKDGRFRGFRDQLRPGFYVPPGAIAPMSSATLEIRAAANPGAVLAAATARVREIDRELPITSAQTLRAFIDTALSQERLMAALVGGLGALALALAAIGTYGVVSFAVAQRTREIGIRVALGATAGDVRRMVLQQVLEVAGTGIVLGVAAALGVTRLISSMLYGVSSADAATYTFVVVLLAAVAGVAGYLPARRAARTDPLTALRCE